MTVIGRSLSEEIKLPPDFAQRVMRAAQQQLRRRHRRRRVAMIVALFLSIAAIRSTSVKHPTLDNLAVRDSSRYQLLPSSETGDDTLASQLAQAAIPLSAGDYLLPSAAPLNRFSVAYADRGWHYDPRWTQNP